MWSNEEKKQFLEIMTGICEIYDKQLSEKSLEFYMTVLEEYNFATVKKALTRYMLNASGSGSFFPKPADIIALIEGDPEDRAEIAWSEVVQALERVGSWKSIKFRDPIINTVIYELGGWMYLGEKTTQELEYLHHQFVKLYRHYAKMGKVPFVKHLVGRVEALNSDTQWKNHYELVTFGSEPPKAITVEFTEPIAVEEQKIETLSLERNNSQSPEPIKKLLETEKLITKKEVMKN